VGSVILGGRMETENSEAARLLTEEEAATILRRSIGAVKRLRLSGMLAYIPGRPPMIDSADLEDCIARMKVWGASRSSPARTSEEREKMVENARAWALKQKMKPPRRPRPK